MAQRPAPDELGSSQLRVSCKRKAYGQEFLTCLDSDPYHVFPSLQDRIAGILPLRNLHWKSAQRGLRTIQEVDVSFVARNAFAAAAAAAAATGGTPDKPHQLDVGMTQAPFVELLFVKCDSSDAYKASVRKEIRSWLNDVLGRKGSGESTVEWLVVLYSTRDAERPSALQRTASNASTKSSLSATTAGSANITASASNGKVTRSSVFSKVKADFNSSKRDRCCWIYDTDQQKEEAKLLNDLASRLKECLLAALNFQISEYEASIKAMAETRSLPGWNFCTYFIHKEGLALTFESVGLLEEALIRYEELAASFEQAQRQNELNGKGSVLSPDGISSLGQMLDGDDQLSLLDPNRKPYRIMILKNEISEFYFRVYLFSRMAVLLKALGRTTELCSRTHMFLISIIGLLGRDRDILAPFFIESFVEHAVTEIVDSVKGLESPASAGLKRAHIGKIAELHLLLQGQFESIGSQRGYFSADHAEILGLRMDDETPRGEAVTSASAEVSDDNKRMSRKLSNTTVRAMVADAREFWESYEHLISKCASEMSHCGRNTTADQLQLNIAYIYHYRNHDELQSLEAFRRVSTIANAAKGDPLAAATLVQQSNRISYAKSIDVFMSCLDSKGLYKDYLHLCVAFLSYVGQESHIYDKYLGLMCNMMKRASVQEEMKAIGHSKIETIFSAFIKITVNTATVVSTDESGAINLQICLSSLLSHSIHIDRIEVTAVPLRAWDTSSVCPIDNVVFYAENVELCARGKDTEVVLRTTSELDGELGLEKVMFCLQGDKIQLFKRYAGRFAQPSGSGTFNSNRGDKSDAAPRIVMRRRDDALRAYVSQPDEQSLKDLSRLQVNIDSGYQDLEQCQVTLVVQTGGVGLFMQNSQVYMEDEVIDVKCKQATIFLDQLKAGSSVRAIVPYTTEFDLATVDIWLDVVYRPSASTEAIRYCTRSVLHRVLDLSVNVHDTYKAQVLISQFTVECTGASSVAIEGIELSSNSTVRAIAPPLSFHQAPKLEAGQKCGQTFMIQPLTPLGPRDAQTLTVSYRCTGTAPKSRLRILHIPFDIAPVDLLHVCSWNIPSEGTEPVGVDRNTEMEYGVPVPVKLVVHTWSTWGSQSLRQTLRGVGLICDVQFDGDAWLLQGKQRFVITHDLDKIEDDANMVEHVESLYLIPTRIGSIGLPRLNIGCRGATAGLITMETIMHDSAEVIDVWMPGPIVRAFVE